MRRPFRREGNLLFQAPQGAEDLRCGVEEQQVLRSRASRALAQDDNAASGFRKER